MTGKKVALVTGASRGIGSSIAKKLAEDGYLVAINYNMSKDRAEEVLEYIRERGGDGMTVKADVSEIEEVRLMFEEVRNNLGEVSLLVSNAGIAEQKQIQDVTPEIWRRFFAVNVDGAFNTVSCAVPAMLSAHSGSIITISSIWGKRGASCESVYSATKAALIGFSKSLASELAPTGIRVNCIAPGVIDTEMLLALPEGVKEGLAEETPLRRLGRPEDIAELVSFLASDRASFITGQVITSDGGFII